MDRNTRNDPYWNRCVFLGATGVFEGDDEDEVCEENENQATVQSQQMRARYRAQDGQRDDLCDTSIHAGSHRRSEGEDQRIGGYLDDEPDPRTYPERRKTDQSTTGPRSKGRYQAELESYLSETYGKRR
jgi:hypothetical protein